MLDKGQIEGWEGDPEEPEAPKVKPGTKPVVPPAAPKPKAAPSLKVVKAAEPQVQAPEMPNSEPETPPQRGGLAGAIFESREAIPTGETVKMTADERKARQKRATWLAMALIGFVVLIFLLTITKIGGNVANWGSAFQKDPREMQRAPASPTGPAEPTP